MSEDDTREQGVEFGEFGEALEEHEYPTTIDEIVEQYGDYEIEMENDSETVEDLLEPLGHERYDSPEDVRQAIFNMVGDEAIGRKGYSDRDSTAVAEDGQDREESF